MPHKTDIIAATTLVSALFVVLISSTSVPKDIGVRQEGNGVLQMQPGDVMMIGNDAFIMEEHH
ncbi:hypothetical protein ACGFOU_25875 [Streptomyces sp. NPDC048595]|uniref:hypothetical protein n=1 Tax=Streptomyces sp. NPDC048595 TaxID=3365576 RepID=UPI003713DF15